MRSRGQVMPMWIIGTISTLTLMFLTMNYANAIRYQIRAQNAADSAASAIISIQAQRWNEMEATLYAANIEEYRFRKLLDGMLLSVDQSGGCNYVSPYDVATTACNITYINQHDPLIRSAVRYSADVQQLNDVTAGITKTNTVNDVAKVLAALHTNCNVAVATVSQTTVDGVKSGGGDCAFTYTILDESPRTPLGNVMQDAQGVYIPSEGSSLAGNASENPDFFAPMKVDVLVCASIPPIVPQLGWMKFGNYVAQARGAATDVMLEQDWMQPGELIDKQRGTQTLFQPYEGYTPYNPYEFYDVDFGGSNATAYNAYNAFIAPIDNNEYDARVGWWGPISIKPYATMLANSPC